MLCRFKSSFGIVDVIGVGSFQLVVLMVVLVLVLMLVLVALLVMLLVILLAAV